MEKESWRIQIEPLATELDLPGILDRLACLDYCFCLDSAMDPEKLGRYSFVGAEPYALFSAKGHKTMVTTGGKTQVFQGNPWVHLKAFMPAPVKLPQLPFPFVGGLVGFLGYDLRHAFEKLPQQAVDEAQIPDCFFAAYDGILVMDHLESRLYGVATGQREDPERTLNRIKGWLERVPCPKKEAKPQQHSRPMRAYFTQEAYMSAVETIRSYIRQGDVYQVNMSQAFDSWPETSPVALYQSLRRKNPAPFAAFLDFGQAQIISSSPERLLRKQGSLLESRPIKGTAPRGRTPEEDARNRAGLLASEKDRAELLMIVDLVRNDLGRVCCPGTIKVPELFHLETYPTVHHLVATVTGEIQADLDILDALAAVFPGGSITGAPKIRAMEIIDELEPVSRHIYTGSIGYIGINGDGDFNIAIRTILYQEGKATFNVGGGVVWDSDPLGEFEETLHKGKALFEGLQELGG